LPIQLNSFSRSEVQQLARCYEIDWDDEVEMRQLMDLVGGHPALVNIAFYHLSRGDITLDKLLKTAPTATGVYHHHLQHHWVNLEAQPELLLALHSVVNANEPISLELIIAYKLSSMGLVKQSSNKVIPNCELYRQFFRSE
jgi:hypothetical protein